MPWGKAGAEQRASGQGAKTYMECPALRIMHCLVHTAALHALSALHRAPCTAALCTLLTEHPALSSLH